MKLTDHFSLEEFVFSQEATRREIDNTPSPEIVAVLSDTARRLEDVRKLLNAPITISSGYRCPRLNAVVGGASDSAHLTGHAADILCFRFGDPFKVCARIMGSDIEFDQLIHEGQWTHIGFSPAMRRQVLTAHFSAGAKTTYTIGLATK